MFAFTDGSGFEEALELWAPPAYFSEALYVLAADLDSRIALTAELLAKAKLHVARVELTDQENERYVAMAAAIDDGEAQAIAIALERGVPLLSDDAAGIAMAKKLGVTSLTTLDLAVQWAKNRQDSEVRMACERLRTRARYGVPREHLHAQWYRDHLD